MKITFYCDVYPWMLEDMNFMAYSRPTIPKPDGVKRYAFSIELPDPEQADVDLGTVAVDEGAGEDRRG